jgi:hypothetical protein
MHADKISAIKKKTFLVKAWVLTLSSFFFHLITDYQKIYLRLEIKINTKNHEKSHFNLSTGQFLFFLQDNQRITLNNVLDLWSKKLDLKKKDVSDFISTIRLWINMIFEIWELIPEQERLSKKKSIDRVCKILDRSDINTSRHFLKS